MPRRFSGADNTSDLIACLRTKFGPSMNDRHNYSTHHPHRSPALFLWIWVLPRRGERVAKDKYCGFKTEAVSPPIRLVLVWIPFPTQRPNLICNYVNVVINANTVKFGLGAESAVTGINLLPNPGAGIRTCREEVPRQKLQLRPCHILPRRRIWT